MDALLSRFSKKGAEQKRLPQLEDVFLAMSNPNTDSAETDYLENRPDLRQDLECFFAGVQNLSHEMIQVAAYFRFKRREQRGEQPLEGREAEDWYAAERQLLRMMGQTSVAA